jgi:hypothetical protein
MQELPFRGRGLVHFEILDARLHIQHLLPLIGEDSPLRNSSNESSQDHDRGVLSVSAIVNVSLPHPN